MAGDFIVGPEGQGAHGADEELLLEIDLEHGHPLEENSWAKHARLAR